MRPADEIKIRAIEVDAHWSMQDVAWRPRDETLFVTNICGLGPWLSPKFVRNGSAVTSFGLKVKSTVRE